MNGWNTLNDLEMIETLREKSFERPQLIFKHSISCGISAHIYDVLHDATPELSGELDLNYLDLINHRQVSNQVADSFEVRHQSPQVIVLAKGKAIYQASHYSIDPSKLLGQVAAGN